MNNKKNTNNNLLNWFRKSFTKIKDEVNWKLLSMTFITSLIPFLYSLFRIYFISESESFLINASSWVYLTLMTEVVMFAGVLPIYRFVANINNKKAKLRKSIFAIIMSIGLGMIFLLIAFCFIPLLADQISNVPGNEGVTQQDIVNFLFVSMFGEFFRIISMMTNAVLIMTGETYSLLLIMIANLAASVTSDILLVSNYALVNPSLGSLSISTLIGPGFTLITFVSYFFIKNRKQIDNVFTRENFSLRESKKYWKIGLITGLEALIRNAFYAGVVLQINNKIDIEAINSWNASMFIWFSVFSIITNSVSQAGIVDFSQKGKDVIGSYTKISIVSYIFIGALIYPVNEFLMPWNQNHGTHVEQAKNITYLTLPFFILMSFNTLLNNYQLSCGKIWKYLTQTIIANVLVMVPAAIIFYGKFANPTIDMTIWTFNASIAVSFMTSAILYFIRK